MNYKNTNMSNDFASPNLVMGAQKLVEVVLNNIWMDLCCFIFCMGLPLLAVLVQLSLFEMGLDIRSREYIQKDSDKYK